MTTRNQIRRAVAAGYYQSKAEMAQRAIKDFLESKGRSTWNLELIAKEDMEQEFREMLDRRLKEAGFDT